MNGEKKNHDKLLRIDWVCNEKLRGEIMINCDDIMITTYYSIE